VSKEYIIDLVKSIDSNTNISEHRNQLVLTISKNKLIDVGERLRADDNTSFDMLTDITAIDWLKNENRFEVVYFLYSNKFKTRLRLKVAIQICDIHCPTVSHIWESANWYERETFDMYGINFDGHPNLRRFYMPEDYNDPLTGEKIFPLRKDFPLMGIPDSLPLPPYPEKFGELK